MTGARSGAPSVHLLPWVPGAGPGDSDPDQVRTTCGCRWDHPPTPTGGCTHPRSGCTPAENLISSRPTAEGVAAWDHVALSSGHAWAPCDVCGEAALQPRTGGRRCFITPACPGTHRPPERPTPLRALRLGLIGLDDIRRHPPDLTDAVTLRRLLGL